jgi:hypothetical protein
VARLRPRADAPTIDAKASSRLTVLGVPIDRLPGDCMLRRIGDAAENRRGVVVSYVNAHSLNLACRDPAYRRVLTASDLGKQQIGTYSQRVVAGLRADSLQSDSSVRWRQTETQLAWDAVKRHEIVGHGLGVFYRPRLVNDIFSGNDGRLYVHNYYLWLLVKGGWIYALATGGLLVLAAHRLVFWTVDDVGERLLRLVLGCGLVGVLAAAVVAPWPAQAGLAGIVGLAVAFGWTHAWRTLPATGGAPVGELR